MRAVTESYRACFGSTYIKIGTIQRRLAWPLRKDDTQIREAFQILYYYAVTLSRIHAIITTRNSKNQEKWTFWHKYRCKTPQEHWFGDPGRATYTVTRLQIKNIKLHIVTDIKVNFNSMLGFRISVIWLGGRVINLQKKVHHNDIHLFQAYPAQESSLACLACLACLVSALFTKT